MSAAPASRKASLSECSTEGAIASACAAPASTKKSAVKWEKETAVDTVRNAVDVRRIASGCAAPASTKKSAVRSAKAIVGATATSVEDTADNDSGLSLHGRQADRLSSPDAYLGRGGCKRGRCHGAQGYIRPRVSAKPC